MKNARCFLFLLILLDGAPAQTDLDGYVKVYDAVRLHGKNDYMVLRNRLRLNLNYTPSEDASGYASFDVKNDQLDDQNALEMTLRELFIDLYSDHLDLRIGKQQIVWGEADGLFITDIVNPLDLREFILADFEDIRMGVNAIKAQVYWGSQRLEAVWIPEFVPARFSSPGEPWSFHTPMEDIALQFPEATMELGDLVEPDKNMMNSEYGVRYSTFVNGVDIAASYFRTWDDYPTFRQSYQFDGDPPAPVHILITPGYDPLTVFGGTFASTLGSLVLRGEGALYHNRNFYTTDPMDADRVVKRDFLNYMLGGELSPGNGFISGQFVQERILGDDEPVVTEGVVNLGTLLLSHSFRNETLKPELFTIYNFTRDDYWVRFDIKYSPVDGMEVLFAVDILGGADQTALFGQFDDNDNIYLKVKYSF